MNEARKKRILIVSNRLPVNIYRSFTFGELIGLYSSAATVPCDTDWKRMISING